jgi:hypothetical protein
MRCKDWWIIASISFLVGLIMSALGYIFMETVAGLYLALIACGFVVSGWALWVVGMISYLRWR